VFSLDVYLLDFVGANWMSMYVLITLLKAGALMTKSTKDDKIVTMLGNLFTTLRQKKVPNSPPPGTEEAAAAFKPKGVEEVPQTSDTIR